MDLTHLKVDFVCRHLKSTRDEYNIQQVKRCFKCFS